MMGNSRLRNSPSYDEGCCQPKDSSDMCFHRFMKFFLGVIVVCALVTPPFMMYCGVAYHYCDDIFPTWLLIGAVSCYIELSLSIFLCKTYKSLGFRNCSYLIIFIFCIIFSLLFFVWWMFGVARVLGPARSYQRGITTDLGIYDDPIMEDPECKLYMFTFPFWLSIVPFIFIGFFFLFTCTFGVVDSYCCED